MDAVDISAFDIYKVGPGPSSSHTIGPMLAAGRFLRAMQSLPPETQAEANDVKVILYGSLSATGKGHGTDRAILAGLLGWQPETCDAERVVALLAEGQEYLLDLNNGKKIPFTQACFEFSEDDEGLEYQNTMQCRLSGPNGVLLEREYYSIGGGSILEKGEPQSASPAIPHRYRNFAELKSLVKEQGLGLLDVVLENEQILSGLPVRKIYEQLAMIIDAMTGSVRHGLQTEGVLPGPIHLERKASGLYSRSQSMHHQHDQFLVCLNAYALAASEENAAGHKVVTAPTSGSSGVIPAIIFMLREQGMTVRHLSDGLLVAAAVGGIVKHNASVSGAEVGCQGEIGVASAMAAALLTYVNEENIERIENAAEIALEHHLGMTCDPVQGYVQIPCIERNAVGAVTAYNAYLLALVGEPNRQKIRFDEVVEAMLETGRDMSLKYRETGAGGLAICTACC